MGAQRGSASSCSWTTSLLKSIAYGLRSLGGGTSTVYAGFLSEVRGHGAFEQFKRPWFPSRSRGEMAMAALPRRAASSSYVRRCPFVSLYSHV